MIHPIAYYRNKIIKKESKIKKIKIFFTILLILFFLSPFFIYFNNSKFSISLPHLHSGDEPHYLVFTSSIIKDLDFDVKNNYASALEGGNDLGFLIRYKLIDHHSIFVDKKDNIRYDIYDIYDPEDLTLQTRKKDTENIDISNFKESSIRYIGLPFFSSIFLWPFRNSINLDSTAILLSAIISLIGFYFLYLTISYFKNKRIAILIIIIFMFATQLWYYAKTFYPDPYIASFLIVSYYLFRIKNKIIIPSILLSIGFLMKYITIIFPAIFAFYLLKEKKLKEFIFFNIPILISLIILLSYNYIVYMDSFFFHIIYEYGNIISGFLGLLFSLDHGLLLFTPFLIFSFLGFYQFYKYKKDEAIFTFLLFFIYFLLFASWLFWDGGTSYATRLLIPIIPLLSMPLSFWYDSYKNKPLKVIFFILIFISFIISIYSVFFNIDYVVDKPPLFYYLKDFYLRLP